MPAIENLSNAALIVLDWQLFFVSSESPAHLPDALGVEGNLCALVDFFLAARKRVVAKNRVKIGWLSRMALT